MIISQTNTQIKLMRFGEKSIILPITDYFQTLEGLLKRGQFVLLDSNLFIPCVYDHGLKALEEKELTDFLHDHFIKSSELNSFAKKTKDYMSEHHEEMTRLLKKYPKLMTIDKVVERIDYQIGNAREQKSRSKREVRNIRKGRNFIGDEYRKKIEIQNIYKKIQGDLHSQLIKKKGAIQRVVKEKQLLHTPIYDNLFNIICKESKKKETKEYNLSEEHLLTQAVYISCLLSEKVNVFSQSGPMHELVKDAKKPIRRYLNSQNLRNFFVFDKVGHSEQTLNVQDSEYY